MRTICAILLAGMLAVGCSGTRAGGPQARPSSPASRTSGDPENRGITKPKRLLIQNVAFGASRVAVDEAISDLKAIELWRPLTAHLYAVKFASRLGRSNVPRDGHLADAYLSVQIDGAVGGGLCDIMFFPTAMRDDLRRWQAYNDQGLLADPAPSWRRFWASIMAHELAHCRQGRNGETAALEWEERALAAVSDAGIP